MSKGTKVPGMLIYFEHEHMLSFLSDEEAGKLFRALMAYGKEKTEPDFKENKALSMAFSVFKMSIDKNDEQYAKKCEANRRNGLKGGRPKKEIEAETDVEKPKKSDGFKIEPNETQKNITITPTITITDRKEKENKKKSEKSVIDAFFEKIWNLYPNKRGMGKISDEQKEELFKIGIEELTRAIERYCIDLEKEEWREAQNGSTFFNSGYMDYLDANYSAPKERIAQEQPGNKNKFHNFNQRTYDFDKLERQLLHVQTEATG